MKILHFSNTPLAGSPIRMCNALNLVGGVKANLVLLDHVGYNDRKHPVDLVWRNDQAEIEQLAKQADVFHFHNYINLNSKDFPSIDFHKYWNDGKAIVRQFHSTDQLIARMSGESLEEVQTCPIPKLVISQYPERFYPNAALVPNIVFDSTETPTEQRSQDDKLRLCYSPSNFRPSRSTRWDTKGYPETIKMLKSLEKNAIKQGTPLEIDIIEQVSHAECLRRKALADIAIDDLVTGSYHMSTLESLMAGSAVLTYMDPRVTLAAQRISGRSDFPALNVRLEEAETIILELLKNPALVRKIGASSREWMLQHWSPEKMATIFLGLYQQVLEEPRKPFEKRFSLDSEDDIYRNIGFHDDVWNSRHTHWPGELPDAVKTIKSATGNLLRRLNLR